MPLTRHFRETIYERSRSDPQFRRQMLKEAVEALFSDEIDLAKSILRDYINATIQFEPLAVLLDKNSKSLQRMFSSAGNPSCKNLFSVLHQLQRHEGIHFSVQIK